MERNTSSGSSAIIAVLVIVVIVIVAWIAYTQGFFQGKDKAQDESGIQINLGGSSRSPQE